MVRNKKKEKGHRPRAGRFTGVAAGVRRACRNYRLDAITRGPNKVYIVQKNAGPKGNWLLRVDEAHAKVLYPHININPDITGWPDPRLGIPGWTPEAAQRLARVVKKANKVMVLAAVALDCHKTAESMYRDYTNGTTRNTVETVCSIAGGWAGGIAGAEAGAAVGTLMLPGIGTVLGGIVGGVAGGISGSSLAAQIVNTIADECCYNIEDRICEKCALVYRCRQYMGENREMCNFCCQLKRSKKKCLAVTERKDVSSVVKETWIQ